VLSIGNLWFDHHDSFLFIFIFFGRGDYLLKHLFSEFRTIPQAISFSLQNIYALIQ